MRMKTALSFPRSRGSGATSSREWIPPSRKAGKFKQPAHTCSRARRESQPAHSGRQHAASRALHDITPHHSLARESRGKLGFFMRRTSFPRAMHGEYRAEARRLLYARTHAELEAAAPADECARRGQRRDEGAARRRAGSLDGRSSFGLGRRNRSAAASATQTIAA